MSDESKISMLEARLAALEGKVGAGGGMQEIIADGMVSFPTYDFGAPPLVPIGGENGMFKWDAEKKQIGAGGVMVGRTWVAVKASEEGKGDGLYSLKVTLGAPTEVEIVDNARLGEKPEDDVSYIPIYRIADGEVTEDYRGCTTVPAYE